MFELGKETSNEWCEGVTDEEYVKKTMDAYDHIHEAYLAKAWMCRRKTMEENFTLGKTPDLRKIDYKIPRTDFIAKKDA